MRTRAPSILTLLAATGTVAAADIVPAAGTSTTSAVGSDANAPAPAPPGAGRARISGSPIWSGPTLAELARDQDEDELLEIVAALAAAGVFDAVSGLPGARRV